MSLREQTLSGLKWTGIAQIARQLSYFVIYILLARLLEPRDFGLVGMIVVFTGFAQLFTQMGLGAALVQKLDVGQRHLTSVFWVNVATGAVLTAIIILCAPLIASFYGEPSLRPLTMVIALAFLIGSFGVVHNALFHKEMRFKRLALIDTASVCIAGVVAITMAVTGWGVWSLVAQSVVATLASVAFMWLLSSWRPVFSFDILAFKELIGFGSNLLGFNILNYWMRNLDNLLIGKFIGTAALGIYSRAYRLMLFPVSQMSGVVSRVMFPAMSSIQGDIPRVRQIFLRSTRVVALVTFPFILGLLAVAKPFVIALLGVKWIEMIPVLKILCVVALTQSVGTNFGWIYTSQGRTDVMFRWGLFSGIVRGAAFVVGLRWGIIGVATAYALSGYVILWYPGWTIPGRLIKLSFSKMLRNLSGVFFCSVAMGAAVWSLGLVLPRSWPEWRVLAVQVPFGAVVYFAGVHLFKLKAYLDLREILSGRFRSK